MDRLKLETIDHYTKCVHRLVELQPNGRGIFVGTHTNHILLLSKLYPGSLFISKIPVCAELQHIVKLADFYDLNAAELDNYQFMMIFTSHCLEEQRYGNENRDINQKIDEIKQNSNINIYIEDIREFKVIRNG